MSGRYKSRGLRRMQWFSMCSRHRFYNPDCHCCQNGEWANRIYYWISHKAFLYCPSLWRWWINRPKSAARKRLEAVFPGLKKKETMK